MTPFEYARLLEYIQKHNQWPEATRVYNRCAIKYVDAIYDSRDGKVWHVKFRSVLGRDDISFRIESEKDIVEIYKFLDSPLR